MKKSVIFTLKAFLAGLLLYLVWRAGYIDLQSLGGLVYSPKLLVILLMVLVSAVLIGVRSFYLIKAFSSQIRLKHAIHLTFIGNFFNYCLPGGTGGDVVKALMLAQKAAIPRWSAIGVVFVDRIIGLFSICLISWMTMITQLDTTLENPIAQVIFIMITIIVIVCAMAYYLLVYQDGYLSKSGSMARRLKNSLFLASVRTGLRIEHIVLPLALTLFSHFIIIYSMYYSALAIDDSPQSLLTYLVIVPVGMTVGSLPITPAGIGVAQVAFFTLFKIYTGVESETPATTISIYQLSLLAVSLSGLYFYLFGNYKVLSLTETDGGAMNE